MNEALMVIPRNPPQAPPSLFRVSRSLKVRGDAIYIIFGGIAGSVVVFFIMMDIALPLALGQFKGEHAMDMPLMLAVLVLSALPMIILFIIFQDKLVKGMMAGAVKG